MPEYLAPLLQVFSRSAPTQVYHTLAAGFWSAVIGFVAVTIFGWLFCATLLIFYTYKTPKIAALMRQGNEVDRSLMKWAVIGAISIGVLWILYDSSH